MAHPRSTDMKNQVTLGAALVTVLAVVGIYVQPGSKSGESSASPAARSSARHAPGSAKSASGDVTSIYGHRPWCGDLQRVVEDFLKIKITPTHPGECFVPNPIGFREPLSKRSDFNLKFVIALVPDPVHTHLSLLFDDFITGIQQAAQDEKYDFDSSSLPWDDGNSSYSSLADERVANAEKRFKEDQPGVILFRKLVESCPAETKDSASQTQEQKDACKKKLLSEYNDAYHQGLVVFVVGEEATAGVHSAQLTNALIWIDALRRVTGSRQNRLGILGPTFSGSLPSLASVLSNPEIATFLSDHPLDGHKMPIYSGSVSSKSGAETFQHALGDSVQFHSFLHDDDEMLHRFEKYICNNQSIEPDEIAIVSEDETAYGGRGVTPQDGENHKSDMAGNSTSGKSREAKCEQIVRDGTPLTLYYPRDISALRGAYQTRSLFQSGNASQDTQLQQSNLPTDLSDPAGRVNDSIRSYGGNQTPMAQEAMLIEIVNELRSHNVEYVLVRASNTLDQLFLTDFLTRNYPEGRIVIFSGDDLLFVREGGGNRLNGVMVVSTYPLFPLQREWTSTPQWPAANRVFGSEGTEGTYIALRLLLNSRGLSRHDTLVLSGEGPHPLCRVQDGPQGAGTIFLPKVDCTQSSSGGYSPVPDYAPPFWISGPTCDPADTPPTKCDLNRSTPQTWHLSGPPTWLSIISFNGFWPLASLCANEECSSEKDGLTGGDSPLVPMPLQMKLLLLFLLLFAGGHACCCWFGSYTAKPAFRAHFASQGDPRHTWLIFVGTCCITLMGLLAGLTSGGFSIGQGLLHAWRPILFMLLIVEALFAAVVGHGYTVKKLTGKLPLWRVNWVNKKLDAFAASGFKHWIQLTAGIFSFALLALLAIVFALKCSLSVENEFPTHWRAMHLASGVSGIVPLFLILIGLYVAFWMALHGLALFGPDRPRLPSMEKLRIAVVPARDTLATDQSQVATASMKDVLRMFSHEDAAAPIEKRARPFTRPFLLVTLVLATTFVASGFILEGEVPIRALVNRTYSTIFLVAFVLACTLALVDAFYLYDIWNTLKRLLGFLDRLPLRRTMATLHGFSWGTVWRMSGNVLEVRYKVISRQLESMNHTIAALQDKDTLSNAEDSRPEPLASLLSLREASREFAAWYAARYKDPRTGDLSLFSTFQKEAAATAGTLIVSLLLSAWREEQDSLIAESKDDDEKGSTRSNPPPPKSKAVANAEEFVCLTYLAFIQNVLGRLRTIALATVALFLAATLAVSSYPFDPRQALSIVLIALFVIIGIIIIKVYAEMHRDSTLSHVTNTRPGELGPEFWFKILGFGIAPLLGLLTRIFPGLTEVIFSWLQPGISALK